MLTNKTMFEIEELTLMVGGTNLKLKTAVKPFDP